MLAAGVGIAKSQSVFRLLAPARATPIPSCGPRARRPRGPRRPSARHPSTRPCQREPSQAKPSREATSETLTAPPPPLVSLVRNPIHPPHARDHKQSLILAHPPQQSKHPLSIAIAAPVHPTPPPSAPESRRIEKKGSVPAYQLLTFCPGVHPLPRPPYIHAHIHIPSALPHFTYMRSFVRSTPLSITLHHHHITKLIAKLSSSLGPLRLLHSTITFFLEGRGKRTHVMSSKGPLCPCRLVQVLSRSTYVQWRP